MRYQASHEKLSVQICSLYTRKQTGVSADSLTLAFKIIFVKYELPKKIMSVVGSTFLSEKFKDVRRNLNIEQAVSSSYSSKAMDSQRHDV